LAVQGFAHREMNSAQCHSELLKAGDRLFEALAEERELRARKSTTCTRDRWQHRMKAARRIVECCAERYVRALTVYRRSAVSELVPSGWGGSGIAPHAAKHRERTGILRPPSVRNHRRTGHA